jgi:DNA-binding response OmpR family regulator
LAIAAAHKPDLVLLDLMLPDVDGMEVCRRLRAAPATSGVPVIMLTARTGESTRQAARQCGVAEYLNKPFDPDVLIEAMKKHAGK